MKCINNISFFTDAYFMLVAVVVFDVYFFLWLHKVIDITYFNIEFQGCMFDIVAYEDVCLSVLKLPNAKVLKVAQLQ